MAFKMSLLYFVSSFVLFAASCVASSNCTFNVTNAPSWNSSDTRVLSPLRSISDGVALRILPLGDSITWGTGSSHGNSYRNRLLQLLSGNTVTYIGSVKSGTMVNNNNEGHSGATISQISVYSENSLHLQPNVVLILAGTNDIDIPSDPAGAPERLGALIDKIIIMCPDAAILVAQIPPIDDPSEDIMVQAYNAAILEVVAARAQAGAKVIAVDMYTSWTKLDSADRLHPNDLGYNRMADSWYGGIQQAAENGWIHEPIPSTGGNHTACRTFLTWNSKYGTIATGVGSGDDAFVPGWQQAGRLATGNVGSGDKQGAGVRLADINGDGRDDYVWIHPVTGAATLYLNGGYSADKGVDWIFKGQIATGLGDGPGVTFADINGDGRDDYLWTATNGEVTAYINGGEQVEGGWLWTSLGRIAGEGTGGTRDTTRFADLDGDGRADYFVVGSDGSLNAWLNLGVGDVPAWNPLGIIATGVGDAAGVSLYDLNNDGRADYIWLAKEGGARAYINNRGPSKGLAPLWIDAGVIATGVGAPRDNIVLRDLNGDGKKDYIRVDPDTGALDVWFNAGTGGAYVTGDGTMFADMDGDGFDDYLTVSPQGAIELWINHGYDTSAQKWTWDSQGQIATGVAARKNIRFADLDGDGAADYLVVDESSGSVVFWQNGGKQSDGTWTWTNMGQVAAGVGDGVGVKFADIDGDGKADYLWVAKNGEVVAYLNGGSSGDGWVWRSQGVIATGTGASRQDVKFADIDGDGLADYLWVNRLDGSVSEWRNSGTADNWQWEPQGEIATGVGANGLSIHFAVLNGNGRADYLNVDPASGAVTQWVNECFGEPSRGTAWQTKQCTDTGITDAGLNPALRWNAVDTSSAWVDAVENWLADKSPTKLRFVAHVSNHFHGPENMACDVTAAHNGCDVNAQCHDVSHPAGMFILNSLVQINQMNRNFFEAISPAETEISANMASFSKTFAPIEDHSALEKLFLDYLGLGFGMLAAPVWNIGLKRFKYWEANPKNHATLKDEVNGMVSSALAIKKDSNSGGIKLDIGDTLETAMDKVIQNWAATVASANSKIFDGSKASIEQLTLMMTDGRVMGDWTKTENLEIQKYIKQAIYGMLNPQAWGMSNKGFHPLILDGGEDCGIKALSDDYLTDETAAATWVCYENHLYYLVSATGKYNICNTTPDGEPGVCFDNRFSPLPGMDALEEGTFGNVNRTDLVIGAVAGYKANGNRNGWPAADPSLYTTVSNLYSAGIQSPGIVMIPICKADLAVRNWNESDIGHANYPCQV